jgi:hypothetical protein
LFRHNTESARQAEIQRINSEASSSQPVNIDDEVIDVEATSPIAKKSKDYARIEGTYLDKFVDEYDRKSRPTQKRMIGVLQDELQTRIDATLRITNSPPKLNSPNTQFTAKDSLKFKIAGNFTDAQYQKIRNAAPDRFASQYSLKKVGKQITDMIEQHSEQIDGVQLKYFKIEDVLKFRIDTIEDEHVYAVITFDYGKGSSKISLYLVNF